MRAPSVANVLAWVLALPGRGWLLCAVLAFSLQAADSGVVPFARDFTVRVWRKEHGLPDDRVLSLLRDHQGFIWIGSRKGVSRFDGRQFKTWSRSTHDAFFSEECQVLAEDREGGIWVGTADGLIQLADKVTRFDVKSITPTVPSFRTHQNAIQTLCASDAGELFVGTFCGLVIRRADGSWQRIQDSSVGLGLDCPGTALAATPDGAVWVGGSTNGLFRRPQIEAPWVKELSAPALAGAQFVRALAATRDGVLHAIVTYDTRFWQWPGRLLRRHATGWEAVVDFDVETRTCAPFLTPDSAGGLWFSITNRVVGHWLNGTRTQYALPVGVVGQSFNCMAEDAEGNLWAGTARDGLVCLLPRRVRSLTAEDGLPDAKTRPLLEALDGTFWVGTDGGVVQMNREERRVLNRASGLASDLVRALAEDAQGRIWTGTGVGLSVWNGVSLEMVLYPGADYRTKIRALLRGRGGAMWVGTAQGLYRLGSGATNAWLVADGLPHEDVCAIHEDRQGRVWIGTDGGGLARLTAAGFEKIDTAKGLSSLRVYALHDDTDGALWIGTDRGLNLLRGERISVLATAHGLPDNLVNSIVEDLRGCLWIGHDRGIYRVRRQELIDVADGGRSQARCLSSTEDDGLLSLETNGQNSFPPALRLRDGRIAFATMGGVALFDPAAPPDLTNGPCVHIEEVRAGGRVLFTGSPGGTGRGQSARPAHRLTVGPADRALLSVHFTASAFRAPEPVSCRYRLLGLSSDWADAGVLRQAIFAGLAPGDYTFELSAANHHGYTSAQPARLDFRVEPRWHERGSVRLGGAVGLLATVAAAVRWRILELRRLGRLEQQAALARERARLAKDLHDGLGASLTEITLLTGVGETSQLSAEALAARFDRLSRRTHDALHSLRDLIWATNPKADSLELLVSRLCRSVEPALEAAGLRCRLDFPTELPPVKLGPEARKALLPAANEAVNNAIRHAQAKQVTLRLRIEAARLVIESQDDGRGFEVAGAGPFGGGADCALGLASMRERLESLGGRCDFQSQPGQGTTVTLRVSLPRESFT